MKMGESRFLIKILHIDQLYLYTESFGNPKDPCCLLVAGAMASARFWTDTFCNYIASRGFFVIRYDHRDIGESSGVVWEKHPYSLSDLGKDAIGILDSYGIKAAHFVGHSMGGYICQKIASEFPKRTLSITIISAGPLPPLTLPMKKEERAALAKTWEIFLGRKEDTVEAFNSVWCHLNGQFPLDEEMAESYTKDLLGRSKHRPKAGNNHELVMRNLSQESRPVIHCQTLIIHGEHDPLSLSRDGEALAQAIPGSKLMTIPGMGHMLFDRKLELQIADIIINQYAVD